MNKKIGAAVTILALTAVFALVVFGISENMRNGKAKHIFLEGNEFLKQKDYQSALRLYDTLIVDFPKSSFVAKALLNQAEANIGMGKFLEAQEIYKNIILQNADLSVAKTAYSKLGDINVKLLFSPIKTPDSIMYKVKDNDSLQSIAEKNNTTVALIKKSNNIKSEIIRPGDNLKLTTMKFSILVNKTRNTLMLKSGEEIVKTYIVSTGSDNCTPVGTFKIANKIIDPPWKGVPSGDPRNILGSRWMGLTIKSYGIHGTTDDTTIGKQCTLGCVRMHNWEVEELYDIVPTGTEVTIVE